MNRRERFQHYLPAPLVATAVLLVLLILLTPVLAPNGPPAAGTIFTQAELIVDHVPPSNVTTFYLHALGSTVRYSEITVWSASGFPWTGGFPSPPLHWTRVTDQSNLIAFQFNSSSNPIVVNITMLYVSAGSQAYYEGIFAFYVGTPAGSSTLSLLSVTGTSGTSLGSGVNTAPISGLPVDGEILLADVGNNR
ncbi:MAG: hypothetical protein L3K02_03960 [Thermoplasmata archaeon]|nr:hypothetical protein [Thermoplasmata archaeon]